MAQVWKTKSLLFCLRYDSLIIFWRQNHVTFIFIKMMPHDLLGQMAYYSCYALSMNLKLTTAEGFCFAYSCFAYMNYCFSFDHQVCFFNEYPWEVKRFAIFTQEWSQEGEKHGFSLHMSRILFAARHCWAAFHMSRQLFAGHMVGSRPMKRKKNLLQMIIDFITVHIYLFIS